MKIEIKHRWNQSVLFSGEFGSLKLAVEAAVRAKTDLSDADLSAANLRDANLSAANLSAANLRDANLSAADLSAANLRDADLSAANLSAANLRDANLSAANLSAADLSDADLSAANLRDANLRDANLTYTRDDIWAVLSAAPHEVPKLREALIAGKVDGSVYEGECACLVGTIANAKGCNYNAVPNLKPNSSRPAERFFMAINMGDTPETNKAAKLALEWIDQWLANVRTLVGAP
jgi:hypothetical protein